MHNSTKRERMADKIRKLLRQAADVEGTPEADSFRMKAYELIAVPISRSFSLLDHLGVAPEDAKRAVAEAVLVRTIMENAK